MRRFALGLLVLCGLVLLTATGCSKPATTDEAPLDREGQPLQSATEDDLQAQADQVTSTLKGGGGKLDTAGQ